MLSYTSMGNATISQQLATDSRVVAIIHRATIGDRADLKYAERRDEAKKRGYKWGAYHLGKPGDPIKQEEIKIPTACGGCDRLTRRVLLISPSVKIATEF